MVISNIISVVQLLTNKRLAPHKFRPGELILTSLCFANLLVGVATFTDLFSYMLTSSLPTWFVAITVYMVKFSIMSSLLHILCLSFERLVSIRFPMYHRNYIDKKKTCIFLFVSWCACMIPYAFKRHEATFLIVLAILMLLCNCVLIPVYIYIYISVKQNVKKTTLRDSSTVQKPTKLERKSTLICWSIVSSFLLCTFPTIIYVLFIGCESTSYFEENIAGMIIFSFVILRSLCDPLVYILRNRVYNCCKKQFRIDSSQQMLWRSNGSSKQYVIKEKLTSL